MMSTATLGRSADAQVSAGAVMDPSAQRRNAWLRRVLLLKISATVAWCAALLVPIDGPGIIGYPRPVPLVFSHLLGAAFLALLVGYVRGLRALNAGRAPVDAVVVGIVSNGLATVFVAGHGLAGAYAQPGWSSLAAGFMWGSAVVTAVVTIGLIAFRPR